MSGVAAILNLDGAPVAPELISRMAEAIKNRGPDGCRTWQGDSIGLVHSHFWTTPEDVGEQQPICAGGSRFWITADARIDNRDELMPRLNGYLNKEIPSDAELILAAYQRWGKECTKRLIGDFAFALWDAHERRLLCARDPVGVRLLHYCQVGRLLFVASSVGAILAGLKSPPPVNYALLQDMLAGQFDRWVHETVYQTIFRLPPSYCLIAQSNGISLTRYWTLGAQSNGHYQSDAEYIDRFRELFQLAVRARMRSTGPPAILVSGGLDSSSIGCMVEHLCSSRNAPVPAHLYSYVFDHTPQADEREYVEAVIKKCSHLEATLVPSDDCWGMREFASDGGYPMDGPETSVDRVLLLKTLRHVHQDGYRVVLWGNWADQLLGSGSYRIPSVLRDVELTRIPAELPNFCRSSQIASWSVLAHAFLRSVIPSRVRKRVARWRSKVNSGGAFAPLCEPSRMAGPSLLPPPCLSSQSSQVSYHQLTSGWSPTGFVYQDNVAAHIGIEWRLPFLDRRLIDFMLRLPPRLRFRDGLNKYVLRQAMAGILPEQVRQRTAPAHIDELIERGLRVQERRRIQQLLEDARVVRVGLVDAERLRAAWVSYWRGSSSYPPRPLIWALCVEAWLRHHESQSSGKTTERRHSSESV